LESIEGYDILEKIGEGGMGQVFRAVHRRLDRPVAIKRLAPHLSQNQDMLRRFLLEARLQARLTHPNVVNIFDLIENEQGIFLVMEYVKGQTARDILLSRGRLSIPEALMIAEGVLNGLAFMHKNDVVHRDIKPSNIMVSTSGTVKVTDFGIARLVNEETGLTRFGGGIGTLHYMAPELIKSGEVSFSIDIYSLGATLHELLSGAPPFIGNTDLEIMMGHLEKTPPALSLPGDDEATNLCRSLVGTALAKTPAQRFPSAEAFLAEVRRIRALMPKPQPAPDVAPDAVLPPAAKKPAPHAPDQAQDRPTSFTPVPSSSPATSAVPVVAPVAETSAADAPRATDAAKTPAAPLPPKTPAATPAASGKRGLWIGLAAAGLAGAALFLALRPGADTPPPTQSPVSLTAPAQPVDKAPPAPTAAQNVPAAPATPGLPADSPAVAAAPAQPDAVPSDQSAQSAGKETDKPGVAPVTPAVQTQAPDVPEAAPEASASQAARDVPPSSPGPDSTAAAEPAVPAAGPAAPESVPAVHAEAPAQQQQAAPAPDAPQQIVYVKVDDARLREKDDISSPILSTLAPGTPLNVLMNAGEWIQVGTPDGRTGYILTRLTAPTPPAAPAPAPARTAKPAPRRPQKPAGEDQGWKIAK